MSRIAQRFQQLQDSKRTALIPFITAGATRVFPDLPALGRALLPAVST
jgi:tryptophan synthase alpha subunit